MRSIFIFLLLTSVGIAQEIPTVNVPQRLRQPNYSGGSCSYASVATLLHWQGNHALGLRLRKYCHGGTNPEVLDYQLERMGVYFVGTVARQDVGFLYWACRTRRGAAVAIYGVNGDPYSALHMVNLVHLDANYAGILDNNDVSQITWMRADDFLQHWVNSGSWAVTPIYAPAPPLPTR